MAFSSSSSSTRSWKYDVFLSFRGPDTRKGIANEICNRLRRSGIKTFMDEHGLQVGDVISPTLIQAIKESRFAIVILSKNYASSAWCLEELREICQSMEDNRILPLFFEVEPTDVRYQKRSFEEAFSKHDTSGRHESEKVEQWRAALEKVANISGWNTNDFKTHEELVDNIVESLRSKVTPDAIEFTDDFQAFGATKEATDKVMKALTDYKITAVGVHGMGGVGKTSMVRHVAAQACRNGTFNHWIMAVVSQNLDLKKIQGTLADLLGFKFVEETEAGRAVRLHKEIMRKEKLLIIVDDVWERTELSKIGIPPYNELQKCKSKVLLTTRRLNVCNDMKCHEKIALKLLSKKDSWNLFLRNAGTISFESTSFEEVARKVAGECKGLPIALVAVARALGDEDQEEWKKAAERLEQSQYVNPNHEECEENAFRYIRLSYDYLKNEDLKSCFLLCCLFPEDHDIKIEDLFRYVIGKRLFRDAKTMEVARGRLVTVVKYLKNSSLLLDSQKKGCVKMHDVIRDTAIQIAKSEDCHRFLVEAGRGLKDWAPRGLHEGCTAISLMNNKIRKLPEEELVCPNLQIFLLNGNAELRKIPEKFIQNLKELRVLDLSNTGISVLPQSFSLLTNLQALYLDDCDKLIDISVVGKLHKLEILSMRERPGGELSREIGHLTNLRILDVNRSLTLFDGRGIKEQSKVTIPSKVISKLQELEELYCGFEEDGSCVAEGPTERTNIIRFDELAGLSNLKILQVGLSDEGFSPKNVEVAPDWDYFCISVFGRCWYSIPASYVQGDRNSRSLFLLNGATISTLPDWFIKAVTEKTEKLEYYRCGGMSDIVMEYDHGRLHKLKHLTVTGQEDELKELMNTKRRVETGPVFENLEELHLKLVFDLEELCVGELPPGSLSNLKVFHVYYGWILRSVSKFVQRLPNLEKLDLNSMLKLEYVFRCEGFEPEQSKLREMHLLWQEALRNICNGPAPHAMFQSLQILTIYRCQLLQSLFASDVAECLVQLEDLLVEDCPLLERVMEAVNKEKTVLPKLKNLVLKNLPLLYGAIAAVDIECPSLEHLMVVGCPKLLFSTSSDLFEAFKSRNQFSFSASTSHPVQLHDPQLYKTLRDRTSGFILRRV
ncbi:PREDICTED: probable disease resistance protein At4g27220 [Fragaria vesca subsp. vesca]|uniref:probable disease resistance protein At4g27220 n=1 Tax=Fragaria vesca subsp. vesca TaxID=101020 RepID=UPI0002C31B28|nr:PREDICTED: probable disease resistance protein At4g27220 [Fragaria vesca subsp. vesca]XP_011461649.1 PREDICTED: probable disease resistance protein At4g27220 [Fragaria vesca subsp. vesca]